MIDVNGNIHGIMRKLVDKTDSLIITGQEEPGEEPFGCSRNRLRVGRGKLEEQEESDILSACTDGSPRRVRTGSKGQGGSLNNRSTKKNTT